MDIRVRFAFACAVRAEPSVRLPPHCLYLPELGCHHLDFFAAAQRFLCAAAILARASGLKERLLPALRAEIDPFGRPTPLLVEIGARSARRARARWSLAISSSMPARMLFCSMGHCSQTSLTNLNCKRRQNDLTVWPSRASLSLGGETFRQPRETEWMRH